MEQFPFVVILLWSAIGFSAYYFLSLNKKLTQRIWKKQVYIHPNIKTVVIQRTWGFMLLGLASLFLVLSLLPGTPADYGLGFSFRAPIPWWAWLSLPLILVLGYFQAGSASNLALYPQIRVKNWSPSTIGLSALSWIAFLIAYEFMFRGFLLFGSLQVLDSWQAIALNCSLYALAHIYKGPGETFGAIPVGIFLCYLSMETGNIWMAVLIHSTMALSNEWFSLRAHPDMKVQKPGPA